LASGDVLSELSSFPEFSLHSDVRRFFGANGQHYIDAPIAQYEDNYETKNALQWQMAGERHGKRRPPLNAIVVGVCRFGRIKGL
jgi:hypothetical protein